MIFIPGIFSSFPPFSFSVVPISPLFLWEFVVVFTGPASFSSNALLCLLFAVDDLVTLFSLDIGVARTVPFVALVRVTPLGPAFTVAERNLDVFVDFVTGGLILEGPRGCSFALPFPSLSTSVVSFAGGAIGVGVVTFGFEDSMTRGNSDESRFSGGGGSGIVEVEGATGSESGVGVLEVLEVDGSNGYGSTGIGGSTEPDLDRETR